jgi:thiol-disulfide isomerase/thioredoxin
MSSKMKTILTFVALAVLIVAAVLLYHFLSNTADNQSQPSQTYAAQTTLPSDVTASPEQSVEIIESEAPTAPDFTLSDLAGNEVALSDYKGMPVVLNFWASWCGYCVQEMPYFDSMAKELEGDVQFLMVNYQESKETAQAYIDQYGYSFDVLLDIEGAVTNGYGVSGFPTTCFIDKDGKLQNAVIGAISEAKLRTNIQALMQ